MQRIFKLIYFAGIVVETLIRRPYIQRRQPAGAGQRATPAERAMFGGLALGMFALPGLYSLTGWLDFANYRCTKAARERLGWLGTGLLGASVWLFWRSHHDLGKNWSPLLEIGQQHTLVTHGLYRYIRHPMYASQLVWSLAQALLLPNWLAGWASLLAFLPLALVRIPAEEQMMLDHFGAEYRAYQMDTGGIVPRLHAGAPRG